MDIEDLRTFVAVADAGGVSAAARRLGVSKSIVSRRLFRVEAELGVQLQEQNLPRVLAKGGLLICCEWESEPEKRWGRTQWADIDDHAAFHYDAPDRLDDFELVVCGVTRSTRSPFVVYRRT